MAAASLVFLVSTSMLRAGRLALNRGMLSRWSDARGMALCHSMDSSALVRAVQDSLDANVNGLRAGAPVLVSLSGGSDSVALFRILVQLNVRNQWDLSALHFNHRIRDESEEEESFVRALADEHGVPVYVRQLSEHARNVHAGFQERSRDWRRAESLALLSELKARLPDADARSGAIMLGHHADDQLETVLLKGLRGCHLSNLHGMGWQDGPFVRPLLDQRKAALVAYLREIGQDWREDQSNMEPRYRRNRVRLELVPLLEELTGGGLHARIAAVEQQSAQLREWLRHSSAQHLASEPNWIAAKSPTSCASTPRGLGIGRLLAQPAILQDELLHLLITQSRSIGPGDAKDVSASEAGEGSTQGRFAAPYAQIRRLRKQLEKPTTEWTLDLGESCSVRRVGDLLTMAPHAVSGAAMEFANAEVVVVDDVQIRYPVGWNLAAGWASSSSELPVPNEPFKLLLHDIPQGATLQVRTARDGDRFHPSWRASDISLASFLRGQKVPLERRRAVPLLCRANSTEVLAVFPDLVAQSVSAPEVRHGEQDVNTTHNHVAPIQSQQGRVLWVELRKFE